MTKGTNTWENEKKKRAYLCFSGSPRINKYVIWSFNKKILHNTFTNPMFVTTLIKPKCHTIIHTAKFPASCLYCEVYDLSVFMLHAWYTFLSGNTTEGMALFWNDSNFSDF